MILPIYAYGHKVLKKVASDISEDYDNLPALIENMWETMYNASGVGLAAPQIGLSIRLFMIDTVQMMEDGEKDKGIKRVFINARITREEGDFWAYEEGCLSIPKLTGDVERQKKISIEFLDENFKSQVLHLEGLNARVVQHEYDHIEGVLFTEKLKPLKKRLISRKLENIRKGKVRAHYRMRFIKL